MLISFYFKVYFHLNKSTRADTVSTDQPESDVALKKIKATLFNRYCDINTFVTIFFRFEIKRQQKLKETKSEKISFTYAQQVYGWITGKKVIFSFE